MSPIVHFIGSWLMASATSDNPRDRRLITIAGVLPDADGLGIIGDAVRNGTAAGEPVFALYQRYHHLLLHGWPAAVVVAAGLALFARRRARVLLLCLVVFHLHLLCDLAGSRGPTPADLWPVCYGEPLFRHPVWFWKGQWKLDGWQNQLVFLALFGSSLAWAVRRGFSFVEVFSQQGDRVFVSVLRQWRGQLFRVNMPP